MDEKYNLETRSRKTQLEAREGKNKLGTRDRARTVSYHFRKAFKEENYNFNDLLNNYIDVIIDANNLTTESDHRNYFWEGISWKSVIF